MGVMVCLCGGPWMCMCVVERRPEEWKDEFMGMGKCLPFFKTVRSRSVRLIMVNIYFYSFRMTHTSIHEYRKHKVYSQLFQPILPNKTLKIKTRKDLKEFGWQCHLTWFRNKYSNTKKWQCLKILLRRLLEIKSAVFAKGHNFFD